MHSWEGIPLIWLVFVTVFVGCKDNDGDGIYMAHAQQGETRLDFHKIASPDKHVYGIGHRKNPNQLFYSSTEGAIYRCDLNGDNNVPIFLDLQSKYIMAYIPVE